MFPGTDDHIVSTPHDYTKRHHVFRAHARCGQYLVQTQSESQVQQWMDGVMSYPPLILDCTHFAGTDTKEALRRFHQRSFNINAKGGPVSASEHIRRCIKHVFSIAQAVPRHVPWTGRCWQVGHHIPLYGLHFPLAETESDVPTDGRLRGYVANHRVV